MRTLALNLALAVVARAGLDLDAEDIPAPCAVICKPVRELTAICDVDGNRVPDDHTEQLLEAQCICTNDSFDVAKITALCASCIKGNAGTDNADDGLEGAWNAVPFNIMHIRGLTYLPNRRQLNYEYLWFL
jgi:hypothetical protein